jgi:CRISPR system Cascade subunit CasC
MTKIMPKVQISFLLDLAAALPNRDQNGRAKRAPYGGTQRQRISSQCYKAAMRSASYLVRSTDDGDVIADNLADLAHRHDLGIAVRSRAIFSRGVLDRLVALGMPITEAETWVEEGKLLFGKSKDVAKGDDVSDEDDDVADEEEHEALAEKDKPGFTKQPLVLGEKEIDAIAAVFDFLAKAGIKPKDAVARIKAKNAGKDAVGEAITTFKSVCGLDGGSKAGIDGVLFGRFATADFISNVDSSLHVAHLLSVNPIAAISDYFTVQDTLLKGIESGGSHQNNVELASSLFLGTIVLDVGQLIKNLGGYLDSDADNARLNNIVAEIVGWLVRSVHSVNPSAKLGSTAPYGNVVETVVEVGKRMPHQHILAFQNAIRPESIQNSDLASEARNRLLAQISETGRKFGAQKHVLTLSKMDNPSRPAAEELAELAKAAVLAELAR